MPERYDVVVVGGGSGGYVAAIRAAQLGLRAAVVERDKVGGTCLHRGCIPTKALLQSAALLDALSHGERLGVIAQTVDFDYAAASANKDAVVETLHKGVQFLLKKNRIETIHGSGRLAGAGHVEVGGDHSRALDASVVILASGSRPRQVPGVQPDGRQVLTSDDALLLDHVPTSAIVVGAGAVGVEFASLWRSLGAEVSLVEMADRLVPLEDHEVGIELQRQFSSRGITCLTGARLEPESLERGPEGVALSIDRGGEPQRLEAEVLLIAVGRTANVEELGLDGTGVRVERGVVTVDGGMRTGQDGVLAIGDMVGGFWLAHKAMHEGMIAAEVAAGRQPHSLDPRLITRTTYCTPQIGSFGLSEQEARDAGHDVRTGVMPFKGNARALIWGEASGFCKVVADASTNSLLGVHIIGHEVTELIAGPALGALLEVTPFEVSRAVAPHPTLSEVLGEAALAVSGDAIHI